MSQNDLYGRKVRSREKKRDRKEGEAAGDSATGRTMKRFQLSYISNAEK